MTEVGDRVWALAQTKIGDDYVFGNDFGLNGGDPNSGDCSGLTKFCWYKATGGDVQLVHHAFTQFHDVTRVCTGSCFASAIAGDLVFFPVGNDCPPNCPGHVAIAQGDGVHVVSATNPGTGVEYRDIIAHPFGGIMGIGRPAGGTGGGGGGGNCGNAGVNEAARYALAQGLFHDRAVEAVAIAGAESGYNVTAENPPGSGAAGACGPWQIYMPAHPEYTVPYVESWPGAADAMNTISAGGTDWSAWSTFGSGAYLAHVPEATVAVDCELAGGGGGGGGGHSGTPMPLPLSRKFDKQHWFRNMSTLEAWSYIVKGQFQDLPPLALGTHRAFDEGAYKAVMRELAGYLDGVAAEAQIPSLMLRTPFNETDYRRTMGLLMDFADSLGTAGGPIPPGGGGGGGGTGGPIFGIDRMANQSVPLDLAQHFAILRVTYGLTTDSPTWVADRFAELVAAGREVLFYHFLRGPGHQGGTGGEEADHFIEKVEDIVGVGNAGNYGLSSDWEPLNGYTTPDANVVEFNARAHTHVNKIGLYTYWCFKNCQAGYPYAMGQDWFWISNVYHPKQRPPGRFDIWQYDIQNGLVDLDTSDMSVAELRVRIHD